MPEYGLDENKENGECQDERRKKERKRKRKHEEECNEEKSRKEISGSRFS